MPNSCRIHRQRAAKKRGERLPAAPPPPPPRCAKRRPVAPPSPTALPAKINMFLLVALLSAAVFVRPTDPSRQQCRVARDAFRPSTREPRRTPQPSRYARAGERADTLRSRHARAAADVAMSPPPQYRHRSGGSVAAPSPSLRRAVSPPPPPSPSRYPGAGDRAKPRERGGKFFAAPLPPRAGTPTSHRLCGAADAPRARARRREAKEDPK